ncbi:hypothetical protein [Silvibacterium acidisoli]|uniref:hypothetical protein n=1 Tax=Acidobacteriaceae bacterium ZG23-2 TaxID=2883246 RepID=UPI00406C184E
MDAVLRKDRLKGYFKRHYRGVSVWGATILFVTFSVKEYLSEREKNLLAGIRAVEATSDDCARLIELSNRIADTAWTGNGDRISTQTFAQRPNDILQARAGLAADMRVSMLLDSELYDADEIFGAVPHSKKTEGLRKVARDAQTAINSDRENVGSLPNSTDDNARPLSPDQISHLEKFHKDVTLFAQAVPAFALEAVSVARQAEQSGDRFLQGFTIAGYVLYVIGWLLTVIGKLNEPEGGRAAETDVGG